MSVPPSGSKKMYAAVTLFVIVCLTVTTHADHHHHPCHSPNMTGFMTALNNKGDLKAHGSFTYDSMGKKLRFRSNESHFFNTSLVVEVLMFFEEGIFYEIDSKNQSCEKKALHCSIHPFDVPDDAKLLTTVNTGNPSIEGEGVKVNVWTGGIPSQKGSYSISTTMGCLPLTTLYFKDSAITIFSIAEVENEIKDPDLLVVPSFCQGQPLEETPEGTVNTFFNVFM